jgi:hypothetical protein
MDGKSFRSGYVIERRARVRFHSGMQLDAPARMQLLKFVCSFAWTDLKVQPQERDLVMRIAGRLGLTSKEVEQVKRWLDVPPAADEVDPATVPRAHRELFVHAAEWAVKADGKVVPAERDALKLFRALMQ